MGLVARVSLDVQRLESVVEVAFVSYTAFYVGQLVGAVDNGGSWTDDDYGPKLIVAVLVDVAREELGRDIGDDVRLATPEGGDAGGGVGNQPKGERLDGGRAAPVFMVRGERHPVVFDPRLEAVRAGPDRVRGDIAGAARL